MIKQIMKKPTLVIVSLLSALIVVICQLAIPLLVGLSLDSMMIPEKAIVSWLIYLVIFAIAGSIAHRTVLFLGQKIASITTKDLRNEVLHHCQTMSLSNLEKWHPGELVSRLNSDIEQVGQALYLVLSQFFVALLTILLTFLVMLWLNGWMALLVLCLTPLSLLSSRFVSKQFSTWFSEMSSSKAKYSGLVHEMCLGHQQIKLFNAESMMSTYFLKESRQLAKASEKAIFYASIVNPMTRFVNLLIYLAILFVGLWFVFEKQLTVGIFVTFLSYAKTYSAPFNDVSSVYIELQSANVSYQRVLEILTIPYKEETNKETKIKFEDKLVIKDVDFSYEISRKIIEQVSFELKKGQTVALVGPTGSGKSTMVNLLLGHYAVDKGQILIDDVSIEKYGFDTLSNLVSVVFQETWIKNGTVRENLCMNDVTITEEDMIKMSKKTTLHPFIQQLPQGYDTVLNQLDDRLSLGQQQLICLTRALLKTSDILILDESTASLDTRTELRLMNVMSEAMKQKTSLVIAHRLSTIKEADVIFVMHAGKIVQKGNHTQLIARDGLYRDLVSSQIV